MRTFAAVSVALVVGLAAGVVVSDRFAGDSEVPPSEAASTTTAGPNPVAPKNVIMFVGDGMGISTVTAARIFEGQLSGATGEENLLSFEAFENVALSKTYSVDSQVTDSAAAMTALMTGTKTNNGLIGVGPGATLGDCTAADTYGLTSWMMLAENAGKATGVVSTSRITHATPAATYAVSPHRNWEGDSDITIEGCEDYPDIARQLIEWGYGDGLEVALGGGRSWFLPNDGITSGPDGDPGNRRDGRNLTKEWVAQGDGWFFVDQRSELETLDLGQVDHLLGLFDASNMAYEHDRSDGSLDQPSLTEMTEAALQVLSADSDGFALVVESGRIDHAHHANNAFRALTETVELSRAVARAVELVDPKETLIVVTADHSHLLTISGYPSRGNPILGIVDTAQDIHGVAFNTLSYTNGPSVGYAHDHDADGDLDGADDPFFGDGQPWRLTPSPDTSDPDYRQQSLVELGSATHGGEDVAIYATGPASELFHGVMEENLVGIAIIAALRLAR